MKYVARMRETEKQWLHNFNSLEERDLSEDLIFSLSFNQQSEYKVFYKLMCWLAGWLAGSLMCRLPNETEVPSSEEIS